MGNSQNNYLVFQYKDLVSYNIKLVSQRFLKILISFSPNNCLVSQNNDTRFKPGCKNTLGVIEQ